MKKITILFISIVVCFSASAQLQVKPHVGLNFSMLSTDPIDYKNPGARAGGLFGVGLKFGEDFYVEPGVQWTSMTYELIHKDDQMLNNSTTINGLRVPVMVGYQFGDNDDLLRFRLFVGPTATFVLGVNQDNSATDVPQKDDFSSMIWGANGGIGLDVWFLYLETGYDFGLSKYYSNTAKFGDGVNHMWWVTLGVNIGG